MANPRYNNQVANSRVGSVMREPTKGKAQPSDATPHPDIGWGGLPGSTQPKARNAGVRKATVYPQSKGL